ncbi:MAG: endo-1,4-beta-xylanase [Firmicutes bacterium]|nr:endo-1,4-beta-xylanase [Bacillota bacterium]
MNQLNNSNFHSPLKKYKHRQACAVVRFLQPDGAPLAGQDLIISQTNHQFLFGCNGFYLVPLVNGRLDGQQKEIAEQRREKFMKLFNFVTLPFYWARFEPQAGHSETQQVMNAAQWLASRGILLKGHPLCWHTLAPNWLLSMDNEEILAAQLRRIQREVSDFRGVIDIWDVINETVIMPIFDKYDNGITRICKQLGRIQTIRAVFEAARTANPEAVLLINDFDISPAFDILVEGCLEAGIRIDVIGIQSHMHQGYWGVEKTLRILEHFERFKLPIHFTETTIISGKLMPPEIVDLNDYEVAEWPSTPEGEERQAQEVLLHYQTLFDHPLVAGVTWWDFADGQWLKAPGGLTRSDASSKPAYEELLKLVKGEWWLGPTLFTTDQEGKIQFNGFLGDYEVTYAEKKASFSLARKTAQVFTGRPMEITIQF